MVVHLRVDARGDSFEQGAPPLGKWRVVTSLFSNRVKDALRSSWSPACQGSKTVLDFDCGLYQFDLLRLIWRFIMEPVDVLCMKIRANDFKFIGENAEMLRSLLSRRNFNKSWRSFVDSLALLKTKPNSDPIKSGVLLFQRSPFLNETLDSGDLPLSLLLAREPVLGRDFLLKCDYSPNSVDKFGKTLTQGALSRARSYSVDHMDAVLTLIKHPKFDANRNDQAVTVCFEGLAWLLIAASISAEPVKIKNLIELTLDALAGVKVNFNSPRSMPDVVYGDKINTPIAYCIKKGCQWLVMNKSQKSNDKLGEVLEFVCAALLRHGADPSLQMEGSQKIVLLSLCQEHSLPQSLRPMIEGGIIDSYLKEKSGVRAAVKRERARL